MTAQFCYSEEFLILNTFVPQHDASEDAVAEPGLLLLGLPSASPFFVLSFIIHFSKAERIGRDDIWVHIQL